jgi:hypothetical protein
MRMMRPLVVGALALAVAHFADGGEAAKQREPRAALAPFNELVGPWRGTGTPSGTREEQQKGFWVENMEWIWKFKDKDVWIQIEFKNGKHFTAGELRYLPGKDQFELVTKTTDKKELKFIGKLTDRVLAVEREEGKEVQRLVITLLHPERFLYRYETRPADRGVFTRKYQVGATREGVEFAKGGGGPECIVTGGLGTSTVSYMGQTYYVCCTGCRDEFNANPKKYIDEYNTKKKKK